MIKVYGIYNCNTVKKALEWLKQNNLSYEFHDYKKKGITKEKLQEWSKHFGWENILNKKGTTWGKLTDEQKNNVNSEQKVIEYLEQNSSAIKRPIVEANNKYLVRFNEQEYRDLLL